MACANVSICCVSVSQATPLRPTTTASGCLSRRSGVISAIMGAVFNLSISGVSLDGILAFMTVSRSGFGRVCLTTRISCGAPLRSIRLRPPLRCRRSVTLSTCRSTTVGA